MSLDLEVFIQEKQATIASLEAKAAEIERELAQERADLEVLLRVRNKQIKAVFTPKRSEYTIAEATLAIFRKTGNPMHADQILALLADYGVATAKQTLVSQLLRDERFELLGKNVFQLCESKSFQAALEEHIQKNGVHLSSNGLSDPARLTLANKAIGCLRSIGEGVTTSALKKIMVERGIVEDSENLFPALHTALKRKSNIVRLGPDKKWILEEWVNKGEAVDFVGRS